MPKLKLTDEFTTFITDVLERKYDRYDDEGVEVGEPKFIFMKLSEEQKIQDIKETAEYHHNNFEMPLPSITQITQIYEELMKANEQTDAKELAKKIISSISEAEKVLKDNKGVAKRVAERTAKFSPFVTGMFRLKKTILKDRTRSRQLRTVKQLAQDYDITDLADNQLDSIWDKISKAEEMPTLQELIQVPLASHPELESPSIRVPLILSSLGFGPQLCDLCSSLIKKLVSPVTDHLANATTPRAIPYPDFVEQYAPGFIAWLSVMGLERYTDYGPFSMGRALSFALTESAGTTIGCLAPPATVLLLSKGPAMLAAIEGTQAYQAAEKFVEDKMLLDYEDFAVEKDQHLNITGLR